MFNRFWRAEESRARRSGGSGLGLSIAVEDARLHGGWLQAWGEIGQGRGVPADVAPRSSGARSTSSPLPLGPEQVVSAPASSVPVPTPPRGRSSLTQPAAAQPVAQPAAAQPVAQPAAAQPAAAPGDGGAAR